MYVAIVNVPGFLPETDPVECDTAREAWEYLEEEYVAHCDSEGIIANLRTLVELGHEWVADKPGAVYAPWPGRPGWRLVYEVAAQDVI